MTASVRKSDRNKIKPKLPPIVYQKMTLVLLYFSTLARTLKSFTTGRDTSLKISCCCWASWAQGCSVGRCRRTHPVDHVPCTLNPGRRCYSQHDLNKNQNTSNIWFFSSLWIAKMAEKKTASGILSGSKNIIAGGCGGICVVLSGHPFDTVKVSLFWNSFFYSVSYTETDCWVKDYFCYLTSELI